jgi:hypothetical protein
MVEGHFATWWDGHVALLAAESLLDVPDLA